MTINGNDAPWEGSTFLISKYGTDQVLTSADKNLSWTTVHRYPTDRQKWKCTKSDGWLYFEGADGYLQRTASGESKLGGGGPKRNEWESFAPRKHPSGGYWIYNRKETSLWVVDSSLTVVKSDNGYQYGFTKV
jgi:hypothetical protein